MQQNKSLTRIKLAGALGVIFALSLLSGCSSENQVSNISNSPAASPATTQNATTDSATTAAKSDSTKTENHTHGGQGGQVIESGPYHLELITINEADGIHIDFFLQKGDNHEAIPDAKVTAQVQLPDGSQKSLNLTYDAAGKHYYTVLPGTSIGEYNVAVLSDISGEKVNARYTFKR